MHIELQFPVLGEELPLDHGYPLYAAVSRVIPAAHNGELALSIGPINGDYQGQGRLRLDLRRSRLRLRLPAEQIAAVLPLAGRSLDVAGHRVRLGVPQVRTLVPAPTLVARMVTIKHSDRQNRERTKDYMTPEGFLAGVQRELTRLGVQGEPGVPLARQGPHKDKPLRRILRIKDRRVVGFALQVTGLTAEESLLLLEAGIGGRRKMGCGWFVGVRDRETGS